MVAKCAGESLVDAEKVYFKMVALGAIFNKILMREPDALPILTDPEALGMNSLFQDTLKEVEVLIFGKNLWSELETSKEGGNGHDKE